MLRLPLPLCDCSRVDPDRAYAVREAGMSSEERKWGRRVYREELTIGWLRVASCGAIETGRLTSNDLPSALKT